MSLPRSFLDRFAISRSVVATIAGLGACCVAACTPVSREHPLAAEVRLAPRADFPVYDGDAAIDPLTGHVRARWRISFVQQGRQADTARLLLNGGFTVSSVTGPAVMSYSSAIVSGDRLVTVLLSPRARGAATSLEIAYDGVLVAPGDSINGISSTWIELSLDSYWHPVFDDYGQRITGTARLTLPRAFRVAGSGTFARVADSTLVLTDRVPLLDLPFSGSPEMESADSLGTHVEYVGARTSLVGRLLATTESCSAYLNGLYGKPDSLPVRTMVLAPRTGPGYARKNYIVITQVDTSSVGLSRFVCHELAHYWSLRANSSGPENWLNEGFAEFISAQFVRATFGAKAYNEIVTQWRTQSERQPAVWTPTSTRRPSAGISYRKAPFLLTQLEARAGPERMQRILTRYMTEAVTTTSALLDVVRAESGEETATWFRDLLGR